VAGPHSTIDLLAQAIAEGAGALLSLVPGVTANARRDRGASWTLSGAIGVHLVLILIENVLMPSATLHHELAVRAIRRGTFARIFWFGAVLCAVASLMMVQLAPLAALLALVASFAREHV
jgi:hypothetical protein